MKNVKHWLPLAVTLALVSAVVYADATDMDWLRVTPKSYDTYSIEARNSSETRTFSVTRTGLVQTGTTACSTATGANDLCINGDLDVTGVVGVGALTVTDLTATGNTLLGNAATDTFTVRGITKYGTGTAEVAVGDGDLYVTDALEADGALDVLGLMTGAAGMTVTGGTVSMNASSNFTTNLGTGTTNAAVTIGGGSNTVEIASTGMDVSTTGAVSGVTDLGMGGTLTITTGAMASVGSIDWLANDNDAVAACWSSTGASGFICVDTLNGAEGLDVGGYLEAGSLRVLGTADVRTATATDDILAWVVTAGGAGRFTGTLSAVDLTADRAWNFPNAAGTVAVSASSPATLSVAGDIGIAADGIDGTQLADTITVDGTGLVLTGQMVSFGSGTAESGASGNGDVYVSDFLEVDGSIDVAANIVGGAALTMAGGVVSLNHNNNNIVNIATGTSTGAVSIGGGANTVTITSTGLDLATDGTITNATLDAASNVIAADTAVGLAADGEDCPAGATWARGVTAAGAATCEQIDLGTDTAGNYASSASEGGAADGLACVTCVDGTDVNTTLDFGAADLTIDNDQAKMVLFRAGDPDALLGDGAAANPRIQLLHHADDAAGGAGPDYRGYSRITAEAGPANDDNALMLFVGASAAFPAAVPAIDSATDAFLSITNGVNDALYFYPQGTGGASHYEWTATEATVHGVELLVEGAGANDDVIGFAPPSGGAGSFVGTFAVADLTADRTYTVNDVDGTVVTTGDTAIVTAAMIGDGEIGDSEIADTVCTQMVTVFYNPTEASATDDYVSLSAVDVATGAASFSVTETDEDQYRTVTELTAHNLSVLVDVAPGALNDPWAVTLRDDGGSTVLTCTIDEAETTCADVIDAPVIAAGSKLDVLVSSAGVDADPAFAAEMIISFCLAP